MRQLALEAIDGSLLGGGVDAQVQVVTLECRQLLQEMRQRSEARTFDELLLQVEEGAFDLPLRARSIRLTRRGPEPVMATQLQELRVPAEVAWLGVQHERLGVID